MTTKTAHTPGPWQVIDRRHAPLKNIQVADQLGNFVAEMQHVHQRDYQGGFKGDHKAADAYDAVGLANARLIAAAPDLLAMCEAVCEVAAEANSEEKFGELVTGLLPGIQAAVAKFYGE